MLKANALRRMVMSLLETGQHPMTVFTMSLWTRKPTPCSCLYPPFHWRKPCVLPLLFRQSSSISFHRFHMYLSMPYASYVHAVILMQKLKCLAEKKMFEKNQKQMLKFSSRHKICRIYFFNKAKVSKSIACMILAMHLTTMQSLNWTEW